MTDETKTASPPYVAYNTFKNTIRALAKDGDLPHQIDNSILPTMSGSAKAAFFQAMRYFGLVDGSGIPSEKLKIIATIDEQDWKKEFRGILEDRYTKEQLSNIVNGTPQSLRDSFKGVSPSIIVPAIRFLVKAASDVEIRVAHHIAKTGTSKTTLPKIRKARKPKPEVPATGGDVQIGLLPSLLSKFPEFDPSWGGEQQTSWFKAYERLLELTSEKGGESNG